MARKNNNLASAKRAQNDEFYTRLEEIDSELRHYRTHFSGKTVLCNCDDPRRSNFYRYFVRNFRELGLKRLITTCYRNTEPNFFTNGSDTHGLKLVYDGGDDSNPDFDQIADTVQPLRGDGSFDSAECRALLEEADIVVTNPPFSRFRDFVALLMKYNKKFLIIGNQNAITYKEIFPLIKENKLWSGISMNGSNRWFEVPEDYEVRPNAAGYREKDGHRFLFVNGVRWFTNMEHSKRNLPLDLYKTYNAEDYPKYDNYDAIECSKVAEIPMDYDGVMGVPITFIDKYCPEQFEIIDINPHFFSIVSQGLPKPKQLTLNNVGKKDPYARILIRRIK